MVRVITLQPKENLSNYDSLFVEIRNQGGSLLFARTFYRPVLVENLRGLPVPNYDGGEVMVILKGYQNANLTYHKSLKYNGNKQQLDSATLLPIDVALEQISLSPTSLTMVLGGSDTTLQWTVKPDGLDPRMRWRFIPEGIVQISNVLSPTLHAIKVGDVIAIGISELDSNFRDSILVHIIQDFPVFHVGQDTILPLGSTGTFNPKVTIGYGQITLFEWDLDGDSVYEGSDTKVLPISHKYDKATQLTLHYRVTDSKGNKVTAAQKLQIVDGLAVKIIFPKSGVTLSSPKIPVHWIVNSVDQKQDTVQNLNPGLNRIVRQAEDGLKRIFSDTVIVFLDSTPPKPPVVNLVGPASTNNGQPSWTWTPNNEKETGVFRISLDSTSQFLTDTTHSRSFKMPVNLKDGLHTLFVSERDSVGNWSASGFASVLIDDTPPEKPLLTGKVVDLIPQWKWKSGGGGIGQYRFGIDDSLFTGAYTKDTITNLMLFDLPFPGYGSHGFFVEEVDSLGNWSAPAKVEFEIKLPPDLRLGGAIFSGSSNCCHDIAFGEKGEPLVLNVPSLNGSHIAYVKHYDAASNSWLFDNVAGWTPSNYYQITINDDGAGNAYLAMANPAQGDRPILFKRSEGKWSPFGQTSSLPLVFQDLKLLAPKNAPPLLIYSIKSTNNAEIFLTSQIGSTDLPVTIDSSELYVENIRKDATYDALQNRIVANMKDSTFSSSTRTKFHPLTKGNWSSLGKNNIIDSAISWSLDFTNGEILRTLLIKKDRYMYRIERYSTATSEWLSVGPPISQFNQKKLNGAPTFPKVAKHTNGCYYAVTGDPYHINHPTLLKYDPAEPSPAWKLMVAIDLTGNANANFATMKIGPDGNIYILATFNESTSPELSVLKVSP